MNENTITISVAEYEELSKNAKKFECLEAVGVDNWHGWDIAMEMYHENDEEDV